jgi:hypothetical protein
MHSKRLIYCNSDDLVIGKVPKECYISAEDSYNNTSSYQTVTVKKGSKLKLNFDVDESGVFLKWVSLIEDLVIIILNDHTFRWDFKTHQHDIRFGIRAVNTQTGEKINEVELRRIEASANDETGFITCQANHRCEFC